MKEFAWRIYFQVLNLLDFSQTCRSTVVMTKFGISEGDRAALEARHSFLSMRLLYFPRNRPIRLAEMFAADQHR
jgi:hypothetical protein